MVYTPQQTPLMEAALQAGAKALGGLWMLVYQGAAAFEMWTSREAPVDLMYEAGLRALDGEP
jgi:shikimate dehydrogenase